jgi:ligand-binding SRPBCC domain-containing protein
MPLIRIVTAIAAPIEVCFDLARDLDLHIQSQAVAGERAVAGRLSGRIELGETVTWEARHLGVRQRFTSKITAFDRPTHFRDEMIDGAFRSFAHDHRFESRGHETIMTDDVSFQSPLGPLGQLIDAIFMTAYLRRLLEGRFLGIKQAAEAAATHGHSERLP